MTTKAKVYQLTLGDKELFRKAADPGNGVGVNYFTSFYFGGREMRPWQWMFHHAAQSQLSVVGGVGCLAADSLILHPDGSETPVAKLAEKGNGLISILSFDGQKIVPSLAFRPFKKGHAKLYRVTLGNDTFIDVTDEHKFLAFTESGPSYLSLSSRLSVGQYLYFFEKSAAFRLASTGGFFRSAFPLSGQSFCQKPQDYLVNYFADSRLCDGQLHQGVDSALKLSPSPFHLLGYEGYLHESSPGESAHYSSRQLLHLSQLYLDFEQQAPESGQQIRPGGSAFCGPYLNTSYGDYIVTPNKAQIVKIESIGEGDYFDLHVPIFNNYIAEGMVHHNSGKTIGAGLSYATWAATTPMYKFMSLAPTGWQSKLMFEGILRESYGHEFERFIWKVVERPYPVIILKSDYIGESKLEFMSAADSAERIQGWEGDAMNLDEAGVLIDAEWLLIMMVTRLRGTVPVPQGGHRNRLKRMSIVTANYDFAPPWLWERMDRMHLDPKNFLSMTPKSSDNLTPEDIESYRLIIPEDQIEQMLEGKKPEGSGEHFSMDSIQNCEDWSINRLAQEMILERDEVAPGWTVEEKRSVGCVHWEMPAESQSGRMYLLVGDPGQGNPPHRNAGVVIVWDITGFPKTPAVLRYFRWVYGRGSYDNFKATYKYAWECYQPIEAVVDNTGTQKLWDEQILLDMGIWAIGVDFSGLKKGMLVACQQQIQRGLYRWPYIQGFRSQLVGYSLLKDSESNKLPQDIVATLMMTSWHLRKYLWEGYEAEASEEASGSLSNAGLTRGGVWIPRSEDIYDLV